MAYLAVRFDAAAADAERWADALLDAGALSVDAVDAHAGTARETERYADSATEETPLWPVCRLTALFNEAADVRATLMGAGERLGADFPSHSIESIADADWVRQTQAQFHPLQIERGLWVVPSWCEPIDAHAVDVRIDPGLAFGSGAHPTTRLCLKWLARHLRQGDSVIDYGCGSGILAIAAALLGAADVLGIDV